MTPQTSNFFTNASVSCGCAVQAPQMFRRSLSLASSAAGVVKKTTGLVGVPVVPNAREVLIALYEKTLKDVQVRGRGQFILDCDFIASSEGLQGMLLLCNCASC